MSKEEQQLFKGIFEGADLKGVQINFVTGEHAKVVYKEGSKEEEQPHFPLQKTKDDGVNTFNFLKEGHYIPSDTPLDSWLYSMGYVEICPKHVVAIMWLKTKEQLRTMLRLMFEEQITSKEIKVADLEKLTPLCFVAPNGKPMKLSKPVREFSTGIDALERFFRPSSDL